MPGALDGVTVLDFTRLLPGPFCTQLLCNLGADVIKVEDPQLGDYMRSGPPIIHDVSYPFAMVNRGKRSLAVDLKTSEGQEILRKLIRRADVVVEQFRPGVMARLGADYDALAMWNPELIYCSFSGYGQNGPYKDLPGHDINFEALAGLLSVTRSLDARRPAIPGVPVADLAGGVHGAVAMLAARFRERTLAEWEPLFFAERLPIAGVKRVPEVVSDPQVKARGLLPTVDVPGVGKLQVISHPAKHTMTETRNPARVPTKGHDTETILRSLGYTSRQIEALVKKNVIAK